MSLRTSFRPCIDLHNGKVKQIVGGSLKDDSSEVKTNFESDKDAAYYATMYSRDELHGGHVIMLGPGNEEAAMSALKAYPNGLQVGGGINIDNACKWLEAGASHVIVTSSIFTGGELDWDKLKALSEKVGKDKLVLDLSCRRVKKGGWPAWFVATDRWQTVTSCEINQETITKLEAYCSEFLVHAADVEGLQQGMDEDLIKRLAIHVSIPTTYAGGAKDLTDLPLVQQLSKGKIDLTIGSALDIFGGNVSYEECVMFNKKTLVGSFSKNEVPLGKSPDHQAIWGEYAEYLEGQRTHGWKD